LEHGALCLNVKDAD